ncbi:hypothetical protein VMY22_25 [Bacillus phage VMY22]|uniref:Uncharacterized protein n=1 Tax=Bacillus phage VMY22 TaxID=1734382 RepID=A0A0N9ST45_9CAUD|nr:hypothetical protein VMY22_25 [Bacillus phage VMY22]ALH46490.1 hypothetical protein VMY22_25 [Bacillus phage VMY22]
MLKSEYIQEIKDLHNANATKLDGVDNQWTKAIKWVSARAISTVSSKYTFAQLVSIKCEVKRILDTMNQEQQIEKSMDRPTNEIVESEGFTDEEWEEACQEADSQLIKFGESMKVDCEMLINENVIARNISIETFIQSLFVEQWASESNYNLADFVYQLVLTYNKINPSIPIAKTVKTIVKPSNGWDKMKPVTPQQITETRKKLLKQVDNLTFEGKNWHVTYWKGSYNGVRIRINVNHHTNVPVTYLDNGGQN